MSKIFSVLLTGLLLAGNAPPPIVFAPAWDTVTVSATEGVDPPPATVEQMDWLLGQWQGEGIDGAPATESWIRGSDDTLVGTFVQQSHAGGVMFTEHMVIAEERGSLVLKIKHFNPDLTGWEEKDAMVTFPLVALDPCNAQFDGLTFFCTARDDPGQGLSIFVRMEKGGELNFRFRRADITVAPQCRSAWDYDAQAVCYARAFVQAEARKDQYLVAATDHFTKLARVIAERGYLRNPDPDGKPDLSTVEAIAASDAAFLAYRAAQCRTLPSQSEAEEYGDTGALTCAIKLTEERTHAIWRKWLASSEVTPSVLPEPVPER